MNRIDGKVAVVTGGTQGVGRGGEVDLVAGRLQRP